MRYIILIAMLFFLSCDVDDECTAEGVNNERLDNGRIVYCHCDGSWQYHPSAVDDCDYASVTIIIGTKDYNY